MQNKYNYPNIPPEVHNHLKNILLRCGPFKNDSTLRAIFSDARISRWGDTLPNAENPSERTQFTIDHLRSQYNTDSENALVLFLRVLSDQTPPGDACHHDLANLAKELECIFDGTDIVAIEDHAQQAQEPQSTPLEQLQLVQTFDLRFSPCWVCFSEEKNHLWISNEEQVEVFELRDKRPISRWLLPSERWKRISPRIWRGYMIVSDWNGNLHLYKNQKRRYAETLYSAKYSDLPFHCLAIGEQGQLIAGTWDGHIFSWDAEGQPLLAPITVPYLPIDLIPCSENRIAVLDQLMNIRLIDASGEQIWTWKVEGVVKTIWAYQADNELLAFLLLVDNDRLVKINTEMQKAQVIHLKSDTVSWSHLKRDADTCWTAIATKAQTLEWLSWSPFRLVEAFKIQLDFNVQQVVAVHDPKQSNALIALGLSDKGQLFATNDLGYRIYSTPVIQNLVLDTSKRFMLWVLEDLIEVYRNPAILPTTCTVELERVDGTLIVGEFHKVSLVLKNTGYTVISRIGARLRGQGRIVPPNDVEQQGRFIQGEFITLDFFVQAIAAGTSVPLELEIELEDEVGPPAFQVHLDIQVESKER